MEFPRDVLPRHLSGGMWKTRTFNKLNAHRHTASALGRRYIAIPPADGWRGGAPEANGWKPTGGKK